MTPYKPAPKPYRGQRRVRTAVALLALTLTACDTAQSTPADAAPPPDAALDALADLRIDNSPARGYNRDRFGAAWADVDRNGCDTRNDILARDLTGEKFKSGTRNCIVLSGTLVDPYSGDTITFRRGQSTSDDVQIDHVVALADAWRSGANEWTTRERTKFANDPANLLAVSGPINQDKSDQPADEWLPPNEAYHCEFAAQQVTVKHTWRLSVTTAEADVLAEVLTTCPEEALQRDD
jgi:hypothetical protein